MNHNRSLILFCVTGLVLLSLFTYGGILDHQFISTWDDDAYVINNPAIRGFTLENIRTACTAYYVSNYAPIQIFSYMLDYTIWGLNPRGFLLTNLVIHILNTLLFFLIAVRIGAGSAVPFSCRNEPLRPATTVWVSLISAFIFLCHPVQVETVAWVSQRKNLLAMLFFLACMHLYCSIREHGPGKRWWRYLLMLLSFSLALLSKPVTVIFPVIICAYELCSITPLHRRRLAIYLAPLLTIALLAGLLAIQTQAEDPQGIKVTHLAGSVFGNIATMLPVLFSYFRLLFMPVDLSIIYAPAIRTAVDSTVLLAAGGVIILAVMAYIMKNKNPRFLFWYLAFFIALLPVSNIIPLVTLINDRYLYFPLLGGSVFAALCLTCLTSRLPSAGRRVARAACIAPLLALPFMARERCAVWEHPLVFWEDALKKAPQLPLPWSAMGTSLLRANLPDASLLHYEQALTLDPHQRTALHNSSILLAEKGDYTAASQRLLQLIRMVPNRGKNFALLGHIYLLEGNGNRAEAQCLRALHLSPREPGAWNILALAYLRRNDIGQARTSVRNALSQEIPGGWNHLVAQSIAAAIEGHYEDAAQFLDRAWNLSPELLDANQPLVVKHLWLRSLEQSPPYRQTFRHVKTTLQ